MPKARVTVKGQVTIPQTVRKLLGIRAGDEVVFIPTGPRAFLQRVPRPSVAELRGVLPASRPYHGREAILDEAEQAAVAETVAAPSLAASPRRRRA